MRYRSLALAACLGTAIAFVAVLAGRTLPHAANAAASDEAAIRNQVEQYRRAFEAKNVDAIMACYAPGDQVFVFDAVPPREYASAEAYHKDWEAFFAAYPGPVKDTISELNLTVVGPVAYSHRIEATEFTKPDGSPQELVARETDIYRKLGGKWLVVHEHVSFPVDVMTGKADLLSKP